MNIIVRNEFRTEVLLSDGELEDFGITYDELDYGNAETRRVLRHLLDAVRERTGVSIGFSGKMLIEAVREKKNGVRICFTSLSPHEEDPKSIKQLIKSESIPFSADFGDFEDILSVISVMNDITESMLFENKGKYRLIMYASPETKLKLAGRLSEFGDVTENAVYRMAESCEHHRCIISCAAVDVLRNSFSVS